MVAASIAVAGPGAESLASQLRAVLLAAGQTGEPISAVEVTRDAALVVAVINTVLVGFPVAGQLWDWWQSHRSSGATVTITLGDGTVIELDDVTRARLEVVLTDHGPTGEPR